jgi:Flp pilus assembly protein TadG
MRHTPSFLSLRRRGERGAIATIVVVLFGTGVLLGCAALTIDLGQMKSERQQLQNGADAVALSVANDCAKLANCLAGDATARQNLANANAMDGATDIARTSGEPAICGTATGLPACAALTSSPTDCVAPVSMPPKWVRVYTRSKQTNGSTILPYSFAKALSGQGTGVEVQACAQAGMTAGYDPLKVVPIIQSLCAWKAATSSGTSFPPLPPYSPAASVGTTPLPKIPTSIDSGQVATIQIMTDPTGGSTNCGKSGPGVYQPGNFGWLDQSGDQNSTCVGEPLAGVIGGTGGVSASTGCSADLPTKVGSIIYIPIAASSAGTGQNVTYTLAGIAAFYLAGVDFEGNAANKLFNGYDPAITDSSGTVTVGCTKDSQGCLWGWYLAPLLPGGTPDPSGGNAGPTTISLLG